MNATVLNAINEQINSEFEASHTYLAMAAFCEQQKFIGAAKWLRLQSDEERPRDEAVRLRARARRRGGAEAHRRSRQAEFDSLGEVFEQALKHEQRVTGRSMRSTSLFQGEGVRRDDRAAVVPHRAGRGGEDRARDRRQVPDGRRRSRRLLDLDRELGSRAAAPKQAR